ncbi:FAD:protein FMN transferase [Acidovorax sp. Root219]|uniref:FAD:protein FMN transferase n=1 Tax=Acidovorax sp. Root219 TaxID=1736493 RepID=UPI000710BE84|nr:FAD:protein FMN transferase [Acidovorax sp. Root219]KRC24167.1 thiamine biosynthesis protein ApbE [Acidovorax sp. Root219]
MSIQVQYGQGFGRAAVAAAPLPALASFGGAGHAAPHAPVRAADPAVLQTLVGEAMGTTWSVRLCNPQFVPLAPVRAAIEEALALVVRQMSNWESESEVSRFNRAPAGSWHALSPEFFTVLQAAQHWAVASGGAFDVGVGQLVGRWGFGPRHDPQADHMAPATMPSAQELQALRPHSVGAGLVLRDEGPQALQPGGLQLDLSGIAKGYSVDLVVQALQAQGWVDFLAEVGGELRASGTRPGGQPWRVAVAGEAGSARALPLQGMAIATSGDHWHAFDHGGRRYSHTIDPRTGEPVVHALASVTVLHQECMHADALATVLTVLGPAAGLAFALEQGVAALLRERTAQGPVWTASPAFAAHFPEFS